MVEISSGAYYGAGYQDVQNRVPKIENTCKELGWEPKVNMEQALKNIFDAYRGLGGRSARAGRLMHKTKCRNHGDTEDTENSTARIQSGSGLALLRALRVSVVNKVCA